MPGAVLGGLREVLTPPPPGEGEIAPRPGTWSSAARALRAVHSAAEYRVERPRRNDAKGQLAPRELE